MLELSSEMSSSHLLRTYLQTNLPGVCDVDDPVPSSKQLQRVQSRPKSDVALEGATLVPPIFLFDVPCLTWLADIAGGRNSLLLDQPFQLGRCEHERLMAFEKLVHKCILQQELCDSEFRGSLWAILMRTGRVKVQSWDFDHHVKRTDVYQSE